MFTVQPDEYSFDASVGRWCFQVTTANCLCGCTWHALAKRRLIHFLLKWKGQAPRHPIRETVCPPKHPFLPKGLAAGPRPPGPLAPQRRFQVTVNCLSAIRTGLAGPRAGFQATVNCPRGVLLPIISIMSRERTVNYVLLTSLSTLVHCL